MAEIQLTQGFKAQVDEEDFELLNRSKWHVSKVGSLYYACRRIGPRVALSTIRMHRVLVDAQKGELVDHIDGDTLNNHRSNLRIVDKSGNMRNGKLSKRNTSGFKGVSYFKRTGRWTASVMIEGMHKRLGYFDTPEEAHLAYRVYLESQLGQDYESQINPSLF